MAIMITYPRSQKPIYATTICKICAQWFVYRLFQEKSQMESASHSSDPWPHTEHYVAELEALLSYTSHMSDIFKLKPYLHTHTHTHTHNEQSN